MKIFTIKNLQLSESLEGVRLNETHLRQGTLDGACGPYALMTMIMVKTGLSLRKIQNLWEAEVDGRTLFGKWLRENYALIQEGTNIDELSDLLRSLKNTNIKSKISSLEIEPLFETSKKTKYSNKEVLMRIANGLRQQDSPLLICVEWDKVSAHWVTAVGYQYTGSEEHQNLAISAILTIDNLSDTSSVAAWNSFISKGRVRAKKLLYVTHSNSTAEQCTVTDAYFLDDKKIKC